MDESALDVATPSGSRRHRGALSRAFVAMASFFRFRPTLFLARQVILACEQARLGAVRHLGRSLRFKLDPNTIRRQRAARLCPLHTTIVGVAGERLRIDLNDHVGWRTYLDSVFDPVPILLADLFCEAGGVYLDVGANVGTTSIPVARLGHQVVGIEPSPRVLSDLSYSVGLNSPIRYTIVNMAASAPRGGNASGSVRGTDHDDGFVELHSPEGNAGATSMTRNWNRSRSGNRVELAKVRTVDEMVAFLGIPRVGLVKLDVEGHEPEALRGMWGLLKTATPPVLFEWRPDIFELAGWPAQDLRRFFPAGYEFYGVRHEKLRAPRSYRVSLLEFDPQRSFENVLALDRACLSTQRTIELVDRGRTEYSFPRT